MVVFEIGGRSLTEKSFKHVIETEIEKLVKFFGEENRDKIEEKVYHTTYVIGHQKEIRFERVASDKLLNELLHDTYADLAPKFLGLSLNDENSIHNFVERFPQWEYVSYNLQDDVEYRAFWASYFENMDTKDFDSRTKHKHFLSTLANFNNPEFIKNLQKRVDDLGYEKIEIMARNREKFYDYDDYLYLQAIEYNAQLKWYLHAKQVICRQALAQVFGERKLVDVEFAEKDISKTFIDYITEKPELRTRDDEFDFESMFDKLTGEHLSLQEYETKYEKQIAYLKDTLLAKFEKMAKQKNERLVRDTLYELQEFLETQLGADAEYYSQFVRFMEKKYDAAAYWVPIKTRLSMVVLPENFEIFLTHEILHGIASDNYSGITGFDDDEKTTALNEVITEFLALKIDGRGAENLDSKLTCSYSAAFPLMEKFLNENLDEIKTFYLNRDVKSLKKLIGKENFKKLCDNLTELLDLSRKFSLSMLKVKQILKNPSFCDNEKLLETINNLKETMQSIENHIAANKKDNLNANLGCQSDENFSASTF